MMFLCTFTYDAIQVKVQLESKMFSVMLYCVVLIVLYFMLC